MTEVYQRFIPRIPQGLSVAPPQRLWQRAVALCADARARFVVLVAAPTTVAALYYGLIAAPQYVSHTEYIVRGVDEHRASGVSALLNTFGVSRAADEISAIESFLKSREVLEKLNARTNLRVIYGSGAADWLSRFPRFWERSSFEDLYAYTRSFVTVGKDAATGVTSLDVAAFDAPAAKAIAEAMLVEAGDMANSLNARAQSDMVDSSKQELAEARDNVVKTQTDLTAFRDRSLLVDPLAFAGAMLTDIGSLSLDRARTEAQISEAERLSPNAPSLDSLKASAEALDQRVDAERAKLAGDNSALAGTSPLTSASACCATSRRSVTAPRSARCRTPRPRRSANASISKRSSGRTCPTSRPGPSACAPWSRSPSSASSPSRSCGSSASARRTMRNEAARRERRR